MQLRPSAIGPRLPANSECSIITNYVSTRANRCKGVVGVKNFGGGRRDTADWQAGLWERRPAPGKLLGVLGILDVLEVRANLH